MAQVNAGRVRFVSRGEYNNSTQYYLFDLVDYNGSSYFAKANTTGNVPTNTTYWQLVAEKGNTGGDGPVGPTGNGIASIAKTASAGLIDTYTITFTDGTTSTFNITNGQDGDVTQEYVDEENERLKSVFNVLPKVSGSGEELELENTGDTMLYKLDLKGNTSQEGTPTPEAPQDIHVVSGDNSINVCGKNLFDGNWVAGTVNLNTGEFTSTERNRTDFIQVIPNTQYTIWTGGGVTTYFIEYDKNHNFIITNTIRAVETQKTFTTNENTGYTVLYQHTAYSPTNKVQLEVGSTATTYEAYKGASYPINLGDIELCKIGDYQDKIYKDNGKWYIERKIGKVVLNGSEAWQDRPNYTYADRFVFAGGINTNQTIGYSNYFTVKMHTENSFPCLYVNATQIGVNFSTKETTTLVQFKTWLGTHNTTVYYVLATPTTTQITDQLLVSQLDELQKAMSYYDKTLISQANDSKPFILDVVAIRDLQDIFEIINQ